MLFFFEKKKIKCYGDEDDDYDEFSLFQILNTFSLQFQFLVCYYHKSLTNLLGWMFYTSTSNSMFLM